MRFQFPSNGKAYPKAESQSLSQSLSRFNSLQTGKHIQRFLNCSLYWRPRVSIPFKRESISKAGCGGRADVSTKVSIPFKRETISKANQDLNDSRRHCVSIPFKRESISKEKIAITFVLRLARFQFPSNGKAYPKRGTAMVATSPVVVSIPFKRESISKEDDDSVVEEHIINEFQFPSNGKAYPKS